jgi:hypothetical protein
MKSITLYRRDFRQPEDGSADFFADIAIKVGLANSYEKAQHIEEIEIYFDHAEITEVTDDAEDDATYTLP